MARKRFWDLAALAAAEDGLLDLDEHVAGNNHELGEVIREKRR